MIWLVVSTPLKNMCSSVVMMTFPTEWENKIHVQNHQRVLSEKHQESNQGGIWRDMEGIRWYKPSVLILDIACHSFPQCGQMAILDRFVCILA